MQSASGSERQSTFFYSIFRVVPDPVREEFINVGLAMADDAGSYSRLQFNPNVRTKLRYLGSSLPTDRLADYFARLSAGYDVAGVREGSPGLAQPPITPTILKDWEGEFASFLRLTPARVFLGGDPDDAFKDLYLRYIGRPPLTGPAVEANRGPEYERALIVRDFVRALGRLPNFDQNRVRQDTAFLGRRRHHWLDVTVLDPDGAPSFAHALPLHAREAKPLFLHRGAVLDAAEDSPEGTVRIAMYEDPPIDREDLLAETAELLSPRGVELVRRNDVTRAAHRFQQVLL